MRIQVVSPMWPSSASPLTGVFVKNLSEALSDAGFEVSWRAVIAGKGRGLAGRSRAHLGLGARILAGAAERADCIYVHAPTWFVPLVELSRRFGNKKLVVHAHGGEVYPHSRVERCSQPLVGWLLRRADLVIAPSRYYANEVARRFGVLSRSIHVSPSGGVNTGVFVPHDRDRARRALSLSGGIVLGFVGRIVEDKGWDVFLQAIASLRRDGLDARGLVVGDGVDSARLDDEARRLRVPLLRLGVRPQADLPEVYSAMDVLLFPTRRGAESLGLVALEAMACGVPVVGSNGYAVPEYVHEGRTGFLAPERDAGAFAAAARRIVELPPDERAAMSARAMETASLYDARRVTRELTARIAALLS